MGRALAQSPTAKQRIVYELNGELQILDVKTGKSAPISVRVPDDGVNRRPSYVSAANLIEQVELSPKGERVLFAARGDIFSAPVEKGPTRNLTHSPGAHDKWPAWSPDGSKVAYHLRRQRRRGDLGRGAGWLGAARKDHQRRPRLPLRSEVVAG